VRLVVPDSSVLSALKSLKCFEHFDTLVRSNDWKVGIPDLVMNETADIVDPSVFNNFRIYKVDKQRVEQLRNRFPTLGDGELSVLVLVLNHKKMKIGTDSSLAILDDKVARGVAKKLGITYFGTLRLLKIMCDSEVLSGSEFIEYLKVLKKVGFRFKESVIQELMRSHGACMHTRDFICVQ